MTIPEGAGDATLNAGSSGLSQLTRQQLAVLVVGAVLRTVVGLVLIGWMMTLVPDDPSGSVAVPVVVAVVITLGYIWFFKRQLASVAKARYPMIRAAEALIMVAAMFLALFAIAYVTLSQADPSAFTEPLDGFTAYYFSLTVLATVGFGDITPVSNAARSITMVQMALDIAFIAVVIRVIGGAAKKAVSQRDDRAAKDQA